MKLYVEINHEKHYIGEDLANKYGLDEGRITPFTGLEVKREHDTAIESARIDEVDTPLRAVTDGDLVEKSLQVSDYPNDALNSETLVNAVEMASQSATRLNEHPGDVEQSNDTPTKVNNTEATISPSENTNLQTQEIKTAIDEPADTDSREYPFGFITEGEHTP